MATAPIWFRGLCVAFAVLLGISAALQLNDPDPVLWTAVYGAGAVLTLLLPRDRRLALPALLLGLACAAWAIYLVQSVWGRVALADLTGKMSEKGGAVEIGREAGGLAIEAAWLLFAAAVRAARR